MLQKITQSEDIKGFVVSRNYTIPKSVATTQKYIMEFFEEEKEETRKAISNLFESDKKISITVDEWINICRRRSINITFHSSTTKFVSGLVKNSAVHQR